MRDLRYIGTKLHGRVDGIVAYMTLIASIQLCMLHHRLHVEVSCTLNLFLVNDRMLDKSFLRVMC